MIIPSLALSKVVPAFFSNEPYIVLYNKDCLDVMDMLVEQYPEGLFDMIFADPPYFLSNGGITCHAGKMTAVDKGAWDKSEGAEANHAFTLEWLSKCQKLLKPNGTIWVSGTHHIIYSVGYAMQQLEMKILNDIIWEKPNPPPNLSCRYFTHSTEIVLWAAKSVKSKHLYNYETMKQLNAGKQMKNVWRFTAPGGDEKEFGKHPTQKPLQLLKRIILASTNKDDLIFDPFTGSGTTGVASVILDRGFMGCELDSEYIKLAQQRIESVLDAKSQSLDFDKVLEI